MTDRNAPKAPSPVRALWIKEWTQMALLRWVGLGIGLAVPLGLLVIARMSEKGWIPLVSRGTHYRLAELLEAPTGVVLALAAGVFALLFGSHVFSADRGAGTDMFLLGAPISSRRLWWVKLGVALAATGVQIAFHVLYWWFLHGLFADSGVGFTGAKPELWIVLLFSCLAGISGGISAAGLRRAPMQVLPIGLLLALAPLIVGAILVNGFPMASFGRSPRISLGLLVAVAIPFGLIAASYFSENRGEPMGRRRWRRALIGIGFSLGLPFPLFFAMAPAVVGSNPGYGAIRLQPNGDRLVIFGSDGGSISTAGTEASRTFLPPPIWFAEWNSDGSRLAICHGGGRFGSVLKQDRLEFRLPNGEPTGAIVEPESGCQEMQWVGDRIVMRKISFPVERMEIFDPETGSIETIQATEFDSEWVSPYFYRQPGQDSTFVLRTAPGTRLPELALRNRVNVEARNPDPEIREVVEQALATWIDVELVEIDAAAGKLSPAPTYRFQLQAVDLITFRDLSWAGAGWGKASRYWMLSNLAHDEDGTSRIFVDTETGRKISVPVGEEERVALLGQNGTWLGRLVEEEEGYRLTIAPFDPALGVTTGVSVVDKFWNKSNAFVRASDDWNRILVGAAELDTETKSWGDREWWIFNAEIASFYQIPFAGRGWQFWVGDRELYSSDESEPSTLNVDTGETRTWGTGDLYAWD